MSVNEYDGIAVRLAEDTCYFGCKKRGMRRLEQSKLWFIIRKNKGLKNRGYSIANKRVKKS